MLGRSVFPPSSIPRFYPAVPEPGEPAQLLPKVHGPFAARRRGWLRQQDRAKTEQCQGRESHTTIVDHNR